MNTSGTEPVAPPRRRRRWWLWGLVGLFFTPFLLVGCIVLYLVSCVHVSSTTRALRAVALRDIPDNWQWNISAEIGSIPIYSARLITAFAHNVPPQARIALRALHSAEVSVYSRSSSAPIQSGTRLHADADRVMNRRGWERVVGVVDTENFIVIYTPRSKGEESDSEVTILVISEDKLVVASLNADLRPLLELGLPMVHRTKGGSIQIRDAAYAFPDGTPRL